MTPIKIESTTWKHQKIWKLVCRKWSYEFAKKTLISILLKNHSIFLLMDNLFRIMDFVHDLVHSFDFDGEGKASHQGPLNGWIYVGFWVWRSIQAKCGFQKFQSEFWQVKLSKFCGLHVFWPDFLQYRLSGRYSNQSGSRYSRNRPADTSNYRAPIIRGPQNPAQPIMTQTSLMNYFANEEVIAETLLRLCWDSAETILRLCWDSNETLLRL